MLGVRLRADLLGEVLELLDVVLERRERVVRRGVRRERRVLVPLPDVPVRILPAADEARGFLHDAAGAVVHGDDARQRLLLVRGDDVEERTRLPALGLFFDVVALVLVRRVVHRPEAVHRLGCATSARQVSCRTARMSATAGLSSTCLSPRRIAATPNKGAVSFVFGSPCSARDNDRKLVLTALRSASSISESTCFRRLSHSRRTSGESRAKMARNVFFSTSSISARRSPNVFAASASRVSCACWNSPSWYTRFLVSDTRLSSLIAAHFSRTASMHSLNASTCALTSPTCFRLSVM